MDLIQRAKNIVLTPAAEWQVIAPETVSMGELYRGYIVPLAAIGPIASFIGLSLVGVGIPALGTYRMPLLSGLSMALISFVLALVGVFVLGLIIDALAPTFGGEKNPLQALKVAAYAYTPAWIAGVLYILPALGTLVLLASLYGLYLLYLGLPVLMKSPKEKAAGYTAVVVVCAIVLAILFSLVGGAVGGAGMHPRGPMMRSSSISGDTGGALAELRWMADKMETAGKRSGAVSR